MDACYRSAKANAWAPVDLEWRGGTTPRIASVPETYDGQVVIKREILPDGRHKLILKDPASGDFTDRIVAAECGDRGRTAQAGQLGTPDGSPASIQRPIDSREKSWSTTIDDAPMTPARPPSDERWTSRSRVASGRERR